VEGDYLLKYWTRNGVVVSDDSGTVVNTELGLVLTNVSRIDAGVYTCTVAWIGGFVSSPPMKLIVYYRPAEFPCTTSSYDCCSLHICLLLSPLCGRRTAFTNCCLVQGRCSCTGQHCVCKWQPPC
jgi:hypothetical protein